MKYDQIRPAIVAVPDLELFCETRPINSLRPDFQGSIAQEITFAVIPSQPICSVPSLNKLLLALVDKLPDCKFSKFELDLDKITFGFLKCSEPAGTLVLRRNFEILPGLSGPSVIPEDFEVRIVYPVEIKLTRSYTIKIYPSFLVAMKVHKESGGTYSNYRSLGVQDFYRLTDRNIPGNFQN